MKMTEYSVRNPVTGTMAALALTVLGVFTFARLKLDMFPDLEFPYVAVITQYPGAGPESVEQIVTRPIESAVAMVQGVEDVNSTSQLGVSMTMVKFAWGTDMKDAEQNVRKNIDIFAADNLPDDATRPLTLALNPSLQPVVFLAVNAAGSPAQVRKMSKDLIEPFLARLPGVASAETIGGLQREIQVQLKPEWLVAYKIPAAQVLGALRAANVLIPGGRVEQGRQELNIATRAQFENVDEIRDVVVGQAGGVPVRVRDVAEVKDGFQEQMSVVRSDGRNAVLLAVRKQSDANTVQVAQRVLKELPELEKRLPAGSVVASVFDQAEHINRSISNLSGSAWMAILLTALVLLVFLRSVRTAVIVLISIPLSLLATFAVMDALGVTLNIISMAGLALAVGMLVDNSIVVLENIFSRLSRGEAIVHAAIHGTGEMAMPIVASTLTTVVVFAPVLFVPGIAGQMFKDMSLTICASLMCSLLVALTLVPMMASLLVRTHKHNWLERGLARLTWWIDPLNDLYGRFVGAALRHRAKAILATLGVFVGSLALFPLLGIDFMAHADQSHINFTVRTAPGSSLATTDAVFRAAEAIAKAEVPEAEVTVSQFGSGEGIAALFGQNAYTGSLQIRLPKRSLRERSQQQIEDVLREKFKSIPGAELRVAQQGLSAMNGAGDVQVKLFSEDLGELRENGQKLKAHLEAVEGASDVVFSMEQGEPELAVEVDREQARLLGLSPVEITGAISTYFLGTTATMYREHGDEYKVMVRAPKEVREDINKLRGLPLVTPLGLVVPLETVASIRTSLGPAAITRENQRRIATIGITATGVPLGTLVERVQKALKDEQLPQNMFYEIAGTAEDLQDSFKALAWALLIAVLLVYMVMASQFESLLEPFVILFAIPLAAAGVIIALVVTKTTLQVTALIGLILLVGVVVNNGIVLVDVLKHRRDEGKDLIEAAIEAGRSRLRPILMTTLTTVFGMVPLAFEIGDGAEMWAPMARAVIGGMTLSTLLTLVVVPVLYVIIATRVDKRKARKAKLRALEEQTPETVVAAVPPPSERASA